MEVRNGPGGGEKPEREPSGILRFASDFDLAPGTHENKRPRIRGGEVRSSDRRSGTVQAEARSPNGSQVEFSASHLISTLPLGLMKIRDHESGAVRFDPPIGGPERSRRRREARTGAKWNSPLRI